MTPYCQDAGIAVTTVSPLARGYLATAGHTARAEHDIYFSWFGDAPGMGYVPNEDLLARTRIG